MMSSDSVSTSDEIAKPILSGFEREVVLEDEFLEEDLPEDNASQSVFNLAAVLLVAVALYDGLGAWRNWFSSSDRFFFSVAIVTGVLIAIKRSKWAGDLPQWKSWVAGFLCASATVLILIGTTRSNPWWSGVPCSMILAGWCIVRIRGESVQHCLYLGAVVACPFLIQSVETAGGFLWLDSIAKSLTSLLADMAGIPHAQLESGLLFKTKTLDRFASIGTLDSVVSLLGIALFCALALRRFLISSALTLLFAVVVWTVVRGLAMTILASQPSGKSMSFFAELLCTLLGAGFVVSADYFLAAFFRPIPFRTFNSKYPFPAFLWNWICGLPTLAVRIPRDNKITARWRAKLHAKGKKSTFLTDCHWMAIVQKEMFRHPLNTIGGILDAFRSWRHSRNWKTILPNSATLFMFGTVCAISATYATRRIDGQANPISSKSQSVCSTESLELACSLLQESDFRKAIGFTGTTPFESPPNISEDALQDVEFFSRRILAIDPTNPVAKYRTGMIHAIRDNREEAFREMNELASDKFGNYPQAHAWLAKAKLVQKANGIEFDSKEMLIHMEMAKRWEKCDYRLPFYFSRLLEARGDISKAVFVLKQAVAATPEYMLELARLYERIGNQEGQFKVANEAEAYFFEKMDLETEKESDRLALADARVLSNRTEEAAEILEEGLRRNPNAERIRRHLCLIQLSLYEKSIREEVEGKPIGDLALLEKAAATDPNNPEVSSEVGKLLTLGVSPTEKLNEFLKNQIELGAASGKSLLFLGDECYTKGDIPGAIRYWENALAKEPNDCTILNNLASCLVVVSPKNVDRASELILKANSLMPDSPDILDTWGEILMAANRPREAVNKFELAIRLDKTREESRRKLIQAYEACGMKEMAEIQTKVMAQLKQSQEAGR